MPKAEAPHCGERSVRRHPSPGRRLPPLNPPQDGRVIGSVLGKRLIDKRFPPRKALASCSGRGFQRQRRLLSNCTPQIAWRRSAARIGRPDLATIAPPSSHLVMVLALPVSPSYTPSPSFVLPRVIAHDRAYLFDLAGSIRWLFSAPLPSLPLFRVAVSIDWKAVWGGMGGHA